MSDADRSDKNIGSSDDILDSEDLFDLDMPIDEPGEEDTDASSAESLEKELEQLLERDEQDNDPAPEQPAGSYTPPMDSADSLETAAPPEPETGFSAPEPTPAPPEPEAGSTARETDATTPEKPQESKKGGLNLANSLMFTLGLVAILVASLAAWLGLDASGNITEMDKKQTSLLQQIKTLRQQQKQHDRALNSQLETMQQQIDTLTKVLASKTTEQWRAAVEQQAVAQKTPHSTDRHAAASADVIPKQPTKPTHKQVAATASSANKPSSATLPGPLPSAAKSTRTARPAPVKQALPSQQPMGEHEVAPGSVKGWVVNIYSVESRDTAERKIRQLEAKQIHAHFVRVPIKGKVWYRIRVSGFKNERAAMVFKKFLREYHGIEGTWYQKLK